MTGLRSTLTVQDQTALDRQTVAHYELRLVKRSASIAAGRSPMPWDEADVRKIIAAAARLSEIVKRQDVMLGTGAWVMASQLDRERASNLRLAQGLRVIRDTTGSGYACHVAERALVEAGVPDPEEDHL